MRRIKLNATREIIDVFRQLKKNGMYCCCWQKTSGTQSVEKRIHTIVVHTVDLSSNALFFNSIDKKYIIDRQFPLLIFVPIVDLIFQVVIRSFTEHQVITLFPKQISVLLDETGLSEAELTLWQKETLTTLSSAMEQKKEENHQGFYQGVSGEYIEQKLQLMFGSAQRPETYYPYNVQKQDTETDLFNLSNVALASLEVEGDESLYLELRTAPRGRPQVTKKVSLLIDDANGEKNLVEYQLFDLSQGGMALQTDNPLSFTTGEEVLVAYIGGKPLDPLLKGTVCSVRKIAVNSNLVKVGIKFLRREQY